MAKKEEIIKGMGTQEIFRRLMVLYDLSATFRRAIGGVMKPAIVNCPFCGAELDLANDPEEKLDKWVQVDARNLPVKLFCSWKHLGRWIIETYERGEQFTERLESSIED